MLALIESARRLNASHKAAERYIAQFPSATLNHAARFVAFVAGSFAALLLFAALVDDVLLERHLFGRTVVWCVPARSSLCRASFGMIGWGALHSIAGCIAVMHWPGCPGVHPNNLHGGHLHAATAMFGPLKEAVTAPPAIAPQRALRRWGAVLGVVLAVSRAFIVEAGVACEPELALLEVVAHTHWLPRHWRGRAHTREVQGQFEQLFQFKARARPPPPHANAGWRTLFTRSHAACDAPM